jgi:DeoR family myo-inositol catabolism operon transcriptional repressor
MDKFIRKEEIFGFIKENRICAVDELQRKYAISLSTLHRDLNELLREGRITKYYGKVAVTEEQNFFNARRTVNVELKKRIAQKALEFVTEGDCLFLDNSTTVYYLAELLCLSPLRNVVVISNSAFISDLFLANKNVDFVSTGGKLNKELNCYVGTHALHVIDDFNASKYFFSCSGLSVEGGISDIYIPDEQAIKDRMREKSRETFLLVDSSKIGRTSVIKWFEPNEVDHIITDNSIDGEILALIARSNPSLIVA